MTQSKPNERCYVAIDLGATSGRVVIARRKRDLLSMQEVHRFQNEPVSYNGGIYWDIQRLWLEIQNGLRAAVREAAGQALSIGVDGWGVDFALLGEGGVLLENPHTYRDPRADGIMEDVLSALGPEFVYETTGVQFFPFNTLYQLYAAWQRTPSLLHCAKSLVTVPDLINFWLTGVIACEYTNATTTQFLDTRTRQWARNVLEQLGMPSHFLTPIAEPGTVLGELRPEVAAQLGIESAVVSIPATHDTASAVAAVEARGNTAFLSSGSWSLLGTEVAEAVVTPESRRFNFANEGGVDGAYMLLKNITGLWLIEGCRRKWQMSDVDLNWEYLLDAAEISPPFEHLFDPDDPAFVRPDDMTIAIDNVCRRAHQRIPDSPGSYTRAILESLAFKYRLVLESLESITGKKIDTIRIIGGGSQNVLLNQFAANATGRKVIAGPTEATALGNIGMQMVATGELSSHAEARELIDRSFPPREFQRESFSDWDRGYQRFKEVTVTESVTA